MRIYIIIKNIILSLFARKTIGVRALVVKGSQVLLVEHTYMPNWYTIGGGVEKGETPKQAINRELMEEVGIEVKGPMKLFNVYHSEYEKRDDYIVFYICDNFIESDNKCPDEIKEKKWFSMDTLPENISPATKRRIDEYLGKIQVSDKW